MADTVAELQSFKASTSEQLNAILLILQQLTPATPSPAPAPALSSASALPVTAAA